MPKRRLQSASEHYARQQRITATGVAAARRARETGDVGRMAAIVALFQAMAARDAADAVPDMLEEQNITPASALKVAVQALVGIASDGRPLESLMSLIETEQQLDMIVSTQIQDAARVSGGLAITSRKQVTGYVRMLNPPSCSRCVILAGKWFKWNAGFDRHPQCDCRHVPAREADRTDLTMNPDDYFHSLTKAEQDKTFGKTGAQAVRDGADVSQVVNARRGMGKTTTVFGDSRGRGRRLMPEAIYELADGDRDKALALLQQHGYLI